MTDMAPPNSPQSHDAATVSPADIIRRTLSAVVLQAGSVSATDANEALDALVADLANALHGRELARLDTERERAEADRAWNVLDWLARNYPSALELCPYKAKR